MLKFLFYANNQLDLRPIIALFMCVVAGISESTLVLIINNAAQKVFQGTTLKALSMIPLFLISLLVLYFLKKHALQLCVKLVEENLEIYRNRIGNQLRHSSLTTMEQMDQGEIYTKLSIDTKKISRASISLILVVQSTTTVLLIIIHMLSFSMLGGGVFISILTFGVLYYKLNYHFLIHTIDEMTKKETELFEEVGHIFDGFKELKLNAHKNEDFFHHYLNPLNKNVKRLRIKIGKQYVEISSVCFNLMFYTALGVVILAFPEDFSELIRFKIIVMYCFMSKPMTVIFQNLPDIFASLVSIDRLNNLEKKYNYQNNLLNLYQNQNNRIRLALSNFNYNQFSFHIKSMMMNLLLR